MIGQFSYLNDLPHFVYVAHSADDSVLYVGVTSDLSQREAYHRKRAQWFGQVARVRLIGPFTGDGARLRAFRFESALIDELEPAFNVTTAERRRIHRAAWAARRTVA